ncbi:MAG: TatD family hydrolase [Pseudomonadota bacterium]
MEIIDSHCHLDFPEFAGDLAGVIQRAEAASVRKMVTISTRVRRFEQVREIAEAHPQVFCSVGTHPHNAGEEPDVTTEELVRLADHPKVVAIGEAGLDYHYDKSPREAQAEGFRRHIVAARETGLPLVIHSRSAEDDTAAILRDGAQGGPFSAVLHCFSSDARLAWAGIELGLYVSFSGILTFKRSDELRALARALPADRLLVETDAPYLAPVPFRGKTNEPAYTAHTLACLAETRDVSSEEMARQTTENFHRLFSKVPSASEAVAA